MEEFIDPKPPQVTSSSYTLCIVGPMQVFSPFFTFVTDPDRGLLLEAYAWKDQQLFALGSMSPLRTSFKEWCEAISDSPHHVVCIATDQLSLLSTQSVVWTSSTQGISHQLRTLLRIPPQGIQSNMSSYNSQVPQVAKMQSFLFLLDWLPTEKGPSRLSPKRKTLSDPEPDDLLYKKFKRIQL